MAFVYSECVEDPQFLFGRKDLLNSVASLMAQRRCSVFMWGERRTGKSSFLLCLKHVIYDKFKNVIPVYIDLSNRMISKNTDAVYAYIGERIASEFLIVYKNELVGVAPREFVPDFTSRDRAIEAFESLTDYIYNKGYRIILLIDEYEYLFEKAFSDSDGFYPIRSISSRANSPLSFIIAGTIHWRVLCHEIGSPALNTTNTIIIGPLDEASFISMIDNEMSDLSEHDRMIANELFMDKEKTFLDFGGNPYFGKLFFANYLWVNKDIHRFVSIIKEPFRNRLSNITRNFGINDASSLMRATLEGGQNQMDMADLGIIRLLEDKHPTLFGTYWSDYVRNTKSQECNSSTSACDIVDNGAELVRRILDHRCGGISGLLEFVDYNETEWLEFKASLLPEFCIDNSGNRQYRLEEDENLSDYVFDVVKAIIGLCNQSGGAVLLGIDDDGRCVGLEPSDKAGLLKTSRDRFTRDAVNPALKPEIKEWQGKKESFKLQDSNLYNLFEYRFIEYEDNLVLAIIVEPVTNTNGLIRVYHKKQRREVVYAREMGEVGQIKAYNQEADIKGLMNSRCKRGGVYKSIYHRFLDGVQDECDIK